MGFQVRPLQRHIPQARSDSESEFKFQPGGPGARTVTVTTTDSQHDPRFLEDSAPAVRWSDGPGGPVTLRLVKSYTSTVVVRDYDRSRGMRHRRLLISYLSSRNH